MSRGVHTRKPKADDGTEEIVLDYKPQVKQNLFHSSTADIVLYGGAAGGGKSRALLMDALIFVIENPGSTACLMRRTFPELEASLIKKSIEYFPPEFCRYNDAKHRWTIDTGAAKSFIVFAHAERESDVLKHRSSEWQYLGIDESTSFSEYMFEQLQVRVRGSTHGTPPKIRLCTNPGLIGHCVTDGDVLTPDGWKDIRSFAVGDPVFTVTPSGALKKTRVDQVHKYDYDGEIVSVRAGDLLMEMTPNHSVAKAGGRRGVVGGKFSLTRWDDLPGQAYIFRRVEWDAKSPERFVLPHFIQRRRPQLEQPDSLAWSDYVEFMGWFLSEGFTVPSRSRFGIAQMKKQNIPKINSLLDRCGFKYRWNPHSAEMHSTKWFNYLLQFGKCRDKFVPVEIKKSGREALRVFFNAMMAGDGHWNPSGSAGCYYTISRRLADDMSEIATKLGYLVSLRQRQRHNRRGLSYEVFFKTTKNGSTELLTGNHVYSVSTKTQRRSNITRRHFVGPVYCLGIKDTHSFVIRQKGSVWISGNSWTKKFFGIVGPGEKGGRPPLEIWRPQKKAGDKYDPPTRQFIPATVFDNQAFLRADPGYLAKLEGLPEDQKRMLLYGEWHGFSGQYFPEFQRSSHMVQPFDIPRHWKLYRSVDFGFAAPFSCHWHAIDERGHCYTYREAYKTGLRDKEQAKMIKDMSLRGNPPEPEPIEYTVGDPSQVVRSKDSGITTQQTYGNVGVDIFPGSNARVPGWMAMRNWLSIDPATGTPYWQIFSTCPELIGEVENVISDVNKPEDVDTKCSDHAIDECRYFFMSRPSPANPLKPAEDMGRYDPSSRHEWKAVEKMQGDIALKNGDRGAILRGFNE